MTCMPFYLCCQRNDAFVLLFYLLYDLQLDIDFRKRHDIHVTSTSMVLQELDWRREIYIFQSVNELIGIIMEGSATTLGGCNKNRNETIINIFMYVDCSRSLRLVHWGTFKTEIFTS